MTDEEKRSFMILARGLEERLRAYYNQHQETGCRCELCENAELAFALMRNPEVEQKGFLTR